jgi:FKBP-type peptidyl-prolyl cis-trans isomerase FklB
MYEGRLIDGTVFDSTMEREDTATLRLTNMIKGWQQTLPKMPEGSKWRLFIPPSHAYGPNGAGDKIGPNETIIFDVKLIEVLGKDSES